MKRQRKGTDSDDAYAAPATLDAADPVTIKEESALSIPGSADSTRILETESFKALNVCMKSYFNVYARSFQDISTFTKLEGLFLSQYIGLFLTDPPYNTCRERVMTNSE